MSDLHLWRLALDPMRLAAIAREQRIPASDEDHGFVGHALLCALFGKATAPKPWALDPRRLILWAYAPQILDAAITDHADPLYHAAVDWSASASKPMPSLRQGQRLAFDLRACPVVRHGGRDKTKSGEHDYLIWIARRDGVDPGALDARAVYAEWLRDRGWRTDAGATITDVQVTGWQKPMASGANAWRGKGDGRVRLPDVRYTGTVVVEDPSAFARFLAHGVGRHRAFGYGMVLLKPAST